MSSKADAVFPARFKDLNGEEKPPISGGSSDRLL